MYDEKAGRKIIDSLDVRNVVPRRVVKLRRFLVLHSVEYLITI